MAAKVFALLALVCVLSPALGAAMRGDGETLELPDNTIMKAFEVPKGLKQSDPDKFKEKVKESRKQFTKNLMDAFGKKRGKEILEASKKK